MKWDHPSHRSSFLQRAMIIRGLAVSVAIDSTRRFLTAYNEPSSQRCTYGNYDQYSCHYLKLKLLVDLDSPKSEVAIWQGRWASRLSRSTSGSLYRRWRLGLYHKWRDVFEHARNELHGELEPEFTSHRDLVTGELSFDGHACYSPKFYPSILHVL